MFRIDPTASLRAAAAGLILAAGTLTAAPALAEGKQNFTLVNKTGYTIAEVYVSPTKAADWEEDVLGRDVLPTSTRVEIRFDRSEKSCLWDLMVVYDDGESAEWDAFDLCTISVIAISYDRGSGDTWAEYE